LLYTILCVVFEARVINLCDRDIATVCWLLHPNVLEGSVLKMAILFATTICSVGLLKLGFIL
jgi:hypothetical protein